MEDSLSHPVIVFGSKDSKGQLFGQDVSSLSACATDLEGDPKGSRASQTRLRWCISVFRSDFPCYITVDGQEKKKGNEA